MLKTVAIINQRAATQTIAQAHSLLSQILDALKQSLVTALQHGFLIILLFCCAILLVAILLKGVLLRKRPALVPGQRAYTGKGHSRAEIASSYDETSFSGEEDSAGYGTDTTEDDDDGVYVIPRMRGWQSRVNAIEAGDAGSADQILQANSTAEDTQDEDEEEDSAVDEEDAADLDVPLEDEDTVEEEPDDNEEDDDGIEEEDDTVDEEDSSDDPVDVSEDSPLSENMLDEEAEGQDASANEEIVSVEDSDEDDAATYVTDEDEDEDEGGAEDSEDEEDSEDGDSGDSGDDSSDGDSGE